MKTLTELLTELDFDDDEQKEILENFEQQEKDFEVGDYRFIKNDEIDNIMSEELLSDKYTLGCCSAWFIADMTGLNADVIEKAQEAESFELLGELLAQKIDEVQQAMVSNDGYGNHFATYDGNEHEIGDYHAFKVN